MPLRSRSWGDDKQVIEEIVFTSIEFPDHVPDAAFQQQVVTDGFKELNSHGPDDEVAPGVPWRVNALPEGFELAVSTRKSMADSQYPVDQLVYSDGLATVSVFIESPEAQTDVEAGFSRVGSTNAYSLTVNGRKVTAIGEVPRRTVEAIATSLTSFQD
jgi:sigma-E factor negative regulatory protein RseB